MRFPRFPTPNIHFIFFSTADNVVLENIIVKL